ncbi:Photosystem II 5 kDa protein chloroplastic-like [Melia azedarach]|uniref:Photosystem II 5 kDa protein chloroplastic-like n=1 Tax=Melia azedarach TaxID=155640 RepID=A0ACC1XJM4_MELAZ|nr:Photosystem II 5 kDa protein chloroplastic-like [Melia azedarach]
MASMTMTASFLGGATSIVSHTPAASRRRLVVASAGRGAEGEKVRMNVEAKPKSSNGRRDLMFAAGAAAAVCSVAGIATAEGPKAGTPEARKFYAPVCVTMPTAKICHK